MRLPGMDETRLALMSRRADVLVDASDTNHLYTLANAWAKEVLPRPALAKQGVSFGMRRDVSAADLQVLNIYLTQRRETGEIDRWWTRRPPRSTPRLPPSNPAQQIPTRIAGCLPTGGPGEVLQ